MADTDRVLDLAAIIREVDGNHSKGAAALAESILDHPDFRAALTKPDEPAVPQGREPAAVTGRPSDEELLDLLPQGNESGFWLPKGLPSDWVDGEFIAPPKAIIAFARDVLARWGTSNLTQTRLLPADKEVAELVEWLREQLHVCLQAPWTPGIKHFGRAAELLERQVVVPVAVSDALIKAECALSDIAEGEPMTDEGDPLKWAERRCADTLAIIRPTMMQHKIRTSEWPPVAATAKPLPEVDE